MTRDISRLLEEWRAGNASAGEEVIAREVELSPLLHGEDVVTLNPADAQWFGCPGRDEGCDAETTCHYRLAKGQLEDADVIVTNAHLLILDDQLRMQPPV